MKLCDVFPDGTSALVSRGSLDLAFRSGVHAPPAPVTLNVISGSVELPTLPGSWPAPSFSPGETHSSESTEGVGWEIRSDVLGRTTTAVTRQDSSYDTAYDGRARECYLGEVSVDLRTHRQTAHADTTYELSWPGVDVRVRSVMDVVNEGGQVGATIRTVAERDGAVVGDRSWEERVRRSW